MRPSTRLPVAKEPASSECVVHLAAECDEVIAGPGGHQPYRRRDIVVSLSRSKHDLRQFLLTQRSDHLI